MEKERTIVQVAKKEDPTFEDMAQDMETEDSMVETQEEGKRMVWDPETENLTAGSLEEGKHMVWDPETEGRPVQSAVKEKPKLNKQQRKQQKLKRKTTIWAIIVSLVLVLSFFAPYFVPNNPYTTDPPRMREGPSSEYLFGTDNLGRCVFSRVLEGARTSIFATIVLVIMSFIFGTIVGVFCGYYGGVLDDIVMRFTDILLSVPQLVLAIAVAGILGGSLINTLIAIGITSWTSYARLARSHAMRIRQLPFINACRLTGCSDLHIIITHVVPNLIGPMLVNATLEIGTTMLSIAGLSFLGLGVAPPAAEWGSMVSEARSYLQLAPWAVFAPALAILLTVMLFNYFGESVCDLANSKEAA